MRSRALIERSEAPLRGVFVVGHCLRTTKAIAGTRLSQSYVYLYLSDSPKR